MSTKTKTKSFDLQRLLEEDSKNYQAKELKEHILDLPDTYIGGVEPATLESVWVCDPCDDEKEGFCMVERDIVVPKGLYKIVDEVITNASDNVVRTRLIGRTKKNSGVQLTKTIKISVNEDGSISIYNDGDGLPVVEHKEHKVMIAEMVFGQLLTSGNYGKNEKRIVGGKNGYGAKLANIFSSQFEVETVDHRRGKKFKQVWTDNMSDPAKRAKITSFTGKAYTKVTFLPDYARFGMTGITPDVVSLIRKRAYDIAGCTPGDVAVHFNGKKIPVKNFEQYVSLYLGTVRDTKRIVEHPNNRWTVIACASPDAVSKQVSFVNGICTWLGGKHVDYVTNQIGRKLCARVNDKGKRASTKGKKKDGDIKPQHVKNNLWVFVHCSIENPSFSSQTKEVLTTPTTKFGSKCELSDDFYKKLEKTEIVERARLMKGFHDKAGLKKTDGKKTTRVKGLPKLEDANWAGGPKSHLCTLILTEGDSAKTFAMSGISIIGRDRYGVFPLKGKILNVRDETDAKVAKNPEIENIKKIIGLRQGVVYNDLSQLRYGAVMILTDQDPDGAHIKGLVMNFFGHYWETLMELGFACTMYTPILKVKRGKKVIKTFYDQGAYQTWRERNSWVKPDNVKYYKGLGTSTRDEAQEYFRNLQIVQYDWDEEGKDAIDLAFNKKRADNRKDWLRHYDEEQVLDRDQLSVPVHDFIHKDLIHFSKYDNERSIPAFCDGMKPSQRKVLYYVLKKNQRREIKVATLAGFIQAETDYHHGESSMHGTIIGMAQDFVGSNNINLLHPEGGFGSRLKGGKDFASPRYIHTFMESVTPLIFRKEDEPLLEFLDADGKQIEPKWYIPIIPMILVNGAHGIGTGFSTHVPCYSPRAIIAALRLLMQDKKPRRIKPWFRHFKGEIVKKGNGYCTRGIYDVTGATRIQVSELPIGKWSEDYANFLEDLSYDTTEASAAKKRAQCITSYSKGKKDDDINVEFILNFRRSILEKMKQDPDKLRDKLRLEESKSCSTSNMHMFDPVGNIVKFKTPDSILRAFYKVRLHFYRKRKEFRIKFLQRELRYLDEKIRFILGIVNNMIKIYKKPDPEVVTEIRDKHHFKPNPLNEPIVISSVDHAIYYQAMENEIYEDSEAEESESEEESEEESELEGEISEEDSEDYESSSEDETTDIPDDPREAKQILNEDYGYLVGMQIRTLTQAKADELSNLRAKHSVELEKLRRLSPKKLWEFDLASLETALVQSGFI